MRQPSRCKPAFDLTALFTDSEETGFYGRYKWTYIRHKTCLQEDDLLVEHDRKSWDVDQTNQAIPIVSFGRGKLVVRRRSPRCRKGDVRMR
jgi:hypothetical protein